MNEMGYYELMIGQQKKMLLQTRIRTILMGLLTVAVVVFGLLMLFSVRTTEEQVAKLSGQMSDLEEQVTLLADSTADLNALSRRLRTDVDFAELSSLVSSAKETLEEASAALRKASELDVDSINSILVQLDEKMDGLTGLIDTINKLDTDGINNMISRLDEIMASLDKLTSALEKLNFLGNRFGRE